MVMVTSAMPERRPLGRPVENAIGHALGAQRLVALLAQNPGDSVDHVGFAATVGSDDAGGAGAAEGDHGALTKRLKANDFHFSQLKQDVPFLSRYAPFGARFCDSKRKSQPATKAAGKTHVERRRIRSSRGGAFERQVDRFTVA